MDSQLSDPRQTLARLRQSLNRGNWDEIESIAAGIVGDQVPATHPELGEYLNDLKDTLIAVKTRRANAMTSLARLRAASGFQNAGRELSPKRQNFAVSTGF
ncbi:MAG TPA: hypothetical protein VFC21_10925 [Bryobacteraceae bacterium]|nr:hypothetical protein [Bryobacteraceae bacterium]